MARVAINTGAAANDGTGDTLRAAGGVINDNFLEVYTYLGAGSTTTLSAPVWSTTNAGINTLRNVGIGTTNPRFTLEVGAVGTSGTTLFVNGDARITGILTIGTSSITLNGSTNIINVGTGVTINGSTGIISATSIVLGGATLTGAGVTRIEAGSGISVDQNTGQVTITATGSGGSSQFVTTAAGIHTLSNVGIGTTNPTSKLTVTGDGTFTGVVTATTFIGALTGTATTATLATDAQGLTGTPNITVGTIGATSLNASGVVTATTFIGALTGTATTATGLSGTPNITVGTIGATSLNASGVTTSGTLNVGTGGTVITTTTAGLVGIGTTNPTSALTVVGSGTSTSQLFVTGVSTFVGLITAGRITAGLTSSIIPFYYDTYASLPSYSTYHGAVAHAHDTGKLYYAHTRWVELVNTESDGTVGTGTERYNIGITSVTTLNVSGVSTFAGITTVTGTTLFAKQLNVSGVSTVGIVTGATYYGDASYVVSGKWTVGNNGASDYTFAGIGFTETTNDPILYLARGGVYEFVITSGGSHPFQIRVSNGGAAYNNGITNNGATSGTLRFEVPFNAPNTLFYQCTSHSGMGNTISIYPNTI